jgi:hypothetical protein
MNSMYVVIENGEPYLNIYTTYAAATAAVKEKYQETIDEQLVEAQGYPICSEIDLPEDESGKTYLYVEKGIHIYVYRLPVAT